MAVELPVLPAEVLEQVFIWASADAYLTYPPKFSAMPWVLTRVCSRWRTVSFNLSALWNSRFHLDGEKSSLNSLVNLSKFPIYGGGLSIRISRDSKHSSLPVFTSDFILLWKQLAKVGPIRDLEIVTQASSAYSFLFDNTAMPDLRSLTLDFHREAFSAPRPSITNDGRPTVFKSMNNLQALSISLRVVGDEALKVLFCKDIPWSQLTSFRFSSSSPFNSVAKLQHCLAQCKSVVFLGLDLTDPKIPLGTPPYPIPLPELTALYYRGTPTSRLLAFGIPWFQLKEVKLYFEVTTIFERGSAHGLLQRLRSVETLELIVSGSSNSFQNLPSPVEFPHLKTLQLTTMYPHVLDSFRCPSLTRLSIAAAHSEDFVGVISIMIMTSSCSIVELECWHSDRETPRTTPDAKGSAYSDSINIAKFVVKYMPNIERIVGLPMMLNWEFIDDITQGQVFPQMREMSCIVPHGQAYNFLRMLSARAVDRGGKRGQLGGQLSKVDVYTDEAMCDAIKPRLDALNRELGTSFAVHCLIERY